MKKENEVKPIVDWKPKVSWIGLGAFTLLLRYLFRLNPDMVESIYSRGIFQGIRFCLDYTLGLLPFPLVYLMSAALLFLLVFKIIKRVKKGKKIKEKLSWQMRIFKGILTLGAFFGAIVFFFYFLWGFNYQRVPIEDHLKIKPEPLDITGIRKETTIAFQMVEAARKTIPGASSAPLDSGFLPEGLESKIRDNLGKVLKSMGYPVPGRVRARKLRPGGLLMYFAVSGIYFPYTGEAYMPANLTAVEIPFTMAHEMAHGVGFTEEGTANFLAYLTCISAKNPVIRYSGCLEYFNYISYEMAKASPHEHKEMIKKLPRGVIADRTAIFQNWAHYRGWLMEIGQQVNDIFLKSQGVKEGVKSYNRLVLLAAAWRVAAREASSIGVNFSR
jgi:hypothetical protein